MILLYLYLLYASATTPFHPTIKRKLGILDHCTIFILDCWRRTPFMLISLRATLWEVFSLLLFGCVPLWVLCSKLFFTGRYEAFFNDYVYCNGFGWLSSPLSPCWSVPLPGLWWLVAGRITYSVGAAFYCWERLPFHHFICGIFFVLGGSICHYLLFVLCRLVPSHFVSIQHIPIAREYRKPECGIYSA